MVPDDTRVRRRGSPTRREFDMAVKRATRTPLGVSVLEFSLRIRFQHGAHCNSLFYYCRLVPWREGDKRNPVLAAAAWPVIAGCIRHNNCT